MGSKLSRMLSSGSQQSSESKQHSGSRQSERGGKELMEELAALESQLSMTGGDCSDLFETKHANFSRMLEVIDALGKLKTNETERRKLAIVPGVADNLSRFIRGGELLYHRDIEKAIDGATSRYGSYGYMHQERSLLQMDFEMKFDVGEHGVATMPTQITECPLTKHNKAINWRKVSIGNKIGEGNFGEVFSGSFCASNISAVAASAHWGLPFKSGSLSIHVALKANKSTNKTDLDEFFRELYLQSSLMHPHVVTFLGATRDPSTGTPYGAFEFCAEGDVRGLLQRAAMVWGDIFRVIMDTCDGMAFLERHLVVHRDLATRNILVGRGKAKIADFGMAVWQGKTRHQAGQKPIKETPIPLRWVSPEVVLERRWSNKSDVWAFGMVILECFSAGAVPYVGMTNPAVYKALSQGQIPPLPKNVPVKLAVIMFDCWQSDADARCSFEDLLCELAVVLRMGDLEPAAPPATLQEAMQVGTIESSKSGYEYFDLVPDAYAKFMDNGDFVGKQSPVQESKGAKTQGTLPTLAQGYANLELVDQGDGSWAYADTGTAGPIQITPTYKLATDEPPAFARYVNLSVDI